MTENLSRLLAVASGAIAGPPDVRLLEKLTAIRSASLGRQLAELLAQRNGFFAFESALLIRPASNDAAPLGVIQWNAPDVWCGQCAVPLGDAIFFGEDLFGVQFCLKSGAVRSFDPETGNFEEIAGSLDSWAKWILESPAFRTGWPLAHQWQVERGPLLMGERLAPVAPFSRGGAVALENLKPRREAQGMLSRVKGIQPR